ncbi:MAG: dipeptide ABC transporter ATP-binding protein [Proteobacteria bacterium]|nr:dipeptide ABC transporter ATP-binding protein [Pseudomonadota bacterium]
MTSNILLSVRGLSTSFETGQGTLRAVDDISFDIARGETFALLGESGSGKSLTALSIMRLLPVNANVSGEVRLAGEDLLALPERDMRRVRGGRIAMIFQEPMTSLNAVLTVGEQIGETLRCHHKIAPRAARVRVVELLDAVGIEEPQRRYYDFPHQLSGGMKQRVMIAMALAGEPELLIADEPTTALDVTIQAQILDLLRRLQKDTGMALLLITHDLGVVSGMAARVAVMYAGQIVEQAPRAQFFAAPKHPYAQKLFDSVPTLDKRGARLAVMRGAVPPLVQEFSGCRFAPRCDFAWPTCREIAPELIGAGEGATVRCHLYDARFSAAAPPAAQTQMQEEGRQATSLPAEGELLVVNDLKVYFPIEKGIFKHVAGYVRAVDGVSLRIRAGRTLALVGESGCGKTTVGKGILQLIRPTAGSVRFAGTELTQLRGAALRARRADFQIIFQDPYSSLNPRMMVADIIEEGMIVQGVGKTAHERAARIAQVLEQVGLPPEARYRYPHEFSGGQRQRISIARALAVNPKLIICDEPTSALDVSVQAQILNLLKTLQEESGIAYLFITHNIAVVEYLADEVAVMYQGRIVEHGSAEQVLRNPQQEYTRALLAAVPKIERQGLAAHQSRGQSPQSTTRSTIFPRV